MARRGGLHPVVRFVLLSLAGMGMLASLFWDEFLAHVQIAKVALGMVHESEIKGGTGQCPLMTGGSVPVGGTADLSRMLKLDDVPDHVTLHVKDEDSLELISKEELAFYDGKRPGRIVLVAVNGFVFNVTEGKKMYAVEGSYASFAGNPITRALVLSSLELKDMNDDLSDLGEESLVMREKWLRFFLWKYPVVAKLVDDSELSNASSGEINCPDKLFAKNELASMKTAILATSNDYVLDVTRSAWLYGDDGVRYSMAMPRAVQNLYFCIGKVGESSRLE